MAASAGLRGRRGRPPSTAAQDSSPRPAVKKARIEESADQIYVRLCTQIITLLDNDARLTPSARDMLKIAAPYSLRPAKADRHKMQESMVGQLAESVHAVRGLYQEAIGSTEGQVEETNKETEAAQSNATEANEHTAGLALLSAAAQKEVDATEAVLEAETAKVAELKEACAEFEDNQRLIEKEKQERQSLLDDIFTGLRDGTLAARSQRDRKSQIDSVMVVLQEERVPHSLQMAVPAALRLKASDRGPYANRSLEFAEVALSKSVADIVERTKDSDGAEQLQAVHIVEKERADLAALLTAKQNKHSAAVDAENTASEVGKDAANVVKKMAYKAKQLSTQLARNKQSFEVVSNLVARFDDLAARGLAAVLESPPEPAAAEPAAPEAQASSPEP